MNRKLSFALALALAVPAVAQTTAPTSVSPAPTPAPPPPTATNAKIALVAFQEAVFATHEGQAKVAEIQKKYEPEKAKIQSLGAEIDSLKKQLDSASGTLSDDEKSSRMRTIDTKTKDLQHEEENAQTNYNGDMGDAFNKLAAKLFPVAAKYASEHGFTLLLNETAGQQNELPTIMWAAEGQDVTKAVIDAYDAQSNVPAPPPSAPSASKPHTSGATHTAPKPAAPAPKQ
jgi:outer membrane protein